MSDTPDHNEIRVSFAPKEADLLSFKLTGRPIHLEDVASEFKLMQQCLKKPFTAEVATRICLKSGSHLIKLVSPRVDGDHAVLRFHDPEANWKSSFLPSVNARDIPFCKVIFRPLEVFGHHSMSMVDHILNPEDHSKPVLQAFAEIFGEDVLDAMRQTLFSEPGAPLKLGAGEFPIIYIPRPDGGDLQVTPVSPAYAFIRMKRVTEPYFQRLNPTAHTLLVGSGPVRLSARSPRTSLALSVDPGFSFWPPCRPRCIRARPSFTGMCMGARSRAGGKTRYRSGYFVMPRCWKWTPL